MKTIFPVLMILAVSGLVRADQPAAKPAQVPFGLLKTQHMVVNILVNGKGPYRVIFDTGAPIMLLNNKVAKESGILPKDFRKPFFAPFGSMGDFTIKTLQIGGLKAHGLKTMVMEQPTVALISKALGHNEGIVGFSFFASFRMTIDYQAKVMTFVPTTFQPPDMMENVTKMWTGMNSTVFLAPAGQWGFRVHKEAKDDEPGVNVREVFAAGFVRPGSAALLVVRRDGKELRLTVQVQPGL